MGDWKPLAGRVSLFGATDLVTSAAEAFRRVWGQEADDFQRQLDSQAPSIAQGRKGHLSLACREQAGRIDFDLKGSPGGPAGTALPFIEDVGAYRDALNAVFLAAKDPGLTTAASRVDLHTDFALICSDVPAANREIMLVIRETYRPTLDAEELFVLQVNNKFPSGRVRGIQLDLLVRWSVDAGPGASTTASVVFDISTGLSERTFNPEEQYLLLDELRQLTSRAQRTLNLNIDGL